MPNLQQEIEDEISQEFIDFKYAHYTKKSSEIKESFMKRVINELNYSSMKKTDLDRVFQYIKNEALQKVKNLFLHLCHKFIKHLFIND